MATTEVTFPFDKPAKILRWKVSAGTMVTPGKILLLYKIATEEKDDKKNPEEKLRAKIERGRVTKFFAKTNEIIQPGQKILLLEECTHPTVMKDLCAECGVDLREPGPGGDSVIVSQASVPMVHCIPELKVCPELAVQIGKEDEKRLLRDKKLALLVDLDQTIVHTTNDDVHPNIKDVHHYKLPGQRSQWYHTRLRPNTRHFLSEMSRLYELHICTFGVREYAHQVAALLDKDGDLFSHRILSRDECFDPGSKYPNLKALFPCGDDMVSIIDDREDVWQGCGNLVQVKPYYFFRHTANIHAPPGMNKLDDPSVPGSSGSTGLPEARSKDSKNGVEKNCQNQMESVPGKMESSENTVSNEIAEEKTFDKDSSDSKSSETKDEDEEVEDKSVADENKNETPDKKESEIVDKNISAGKKETVDKNETADDKETADKNKNETTDQEADEASNKKPQENADQGVDRSKDEPTSKVNKKENNVEDPKEVENEVKVEDEVEFEDQDDYLLYLEDILRRIHKEYYTDLEKETGRRSLRDIIPRVRAGVLKGLTLTFSGIIPTHQKLYQSRAFKVARAFGANVTQELRDDTTHLVAMKPGTQKVHVAKKRGDIKIVNPDWLWTCAERWEHVDERLFNLTAKVRGSRIPPAHCSNPEPVKTTKNPKTKKDDFANTINPLFFVSKEEISDMDKEVEEDMSDKEVEDDMSDAEVDPSVYDFDDQMDNSEIGKREHESSDSIDSIEEFDGTTPSKRRREEYPDLFDNSQDSVDLEAADIEDDGEWNAMGAALEREFLSD